ncbi:MAG: YihY/virulence factor BrkB family protein [Mycobacteriales bacterium]
MPSEPISRREAVPSARRVIIERATVEQQRIRETVRDTVGPVARRGPVRLFRATLSKAWQDRVLGLSAEAAFWQLLSIPPLLLALLGSVGYVADFFGPDTVNSIERQLLTSVGRVLTPGVVAQLVKPSLDQILRGGRADVITIGFLLSLWAGSSSTATFVNTITIAYDMRDMRGAIRSRLIALWLYVVAVVIGIVLLPVMVLGPSKIVALMPGNLQSDARVLVNGLYWPTVAILLLLGLTSLYHLSLPRRLPWLRQIPGAVFAGCIFVVGSYIVREYFTFVSRRAYSYGALAAPIAALLFLFVIALAVLLGAELNAVIQQTWPGERSRRARKRALSAVRRAQLDRDALAAREGGKPYSPPDGIDS